MTAKNWNIAFIILIVITYAAIFWPSKGLYFEYGRIHGERDALSKDLEVVHSQNKVLTSQIDSLEVVANLERDTIEIEIPVYFERKRNEIKNSTDSVADSVAVSILERYRS